MVYYGEWRPKTGETGLNLGRLLNNVNKSFEFCECMTLNIKNLGHWQDAIYWVHTNANFYKRKMLYKMPRKVVRDILIFIMSYLSDWGIQILSVIRYHIRSKLGIFLSVYVFAFFLVLSFDWEIETMGGQFQNDCKLHDYIYYIFKLLNLCCTEKPRLVWQ